jgi:hypothetical protein
MTQYRPPAKCPVKRSDLRMYKQMVLSGQWNPTPEQRGKIAGEAAEAVRTGTMRQKIIATELLAAMREQQLANEKKMQADATAP